MAYPSSTRDRTCTSGVGHVGRLQQEEFQAAKVQGRAELEVSGLFPCFYVIGAWPPVQESDEINFSANESKCGASVAWPGRDWFEAAQEKLDEERAKIVGGYGKNIWWLRKARSGSGEEKKK